MRAAGGRWNCEQGWFNSCLQTGFSGLNIVRCVHTPSIGKFLPPHPTPSLCEPPGLLKNIISCQLMLVYTFLFARKKISLLQTWTYFKTPALKQGLRKQWWSPDFCLALPRAYLLQPTKSAPAFLAIGSCSATPWGFYFFSPSLRYKLMRRLSAEVAGKHGAVAAPPWSLNWASPGNRFAAGCPAPPQLHQRS